MTLPLSRYGDVIDLDVPFEAGPPLAAAEVARIAAEICNHLFAEGFTDSAGWRQQDPMQVLRALTTLRPPSPVAAEIAGDLDRLLQWVVRQSDVVKAADLRPVCETHPGGLSPVADKLALWRGDITTLQADAIVNAANSAMLGCFSPFHPCIDNAIHWVAGPRLRLDCSTIMALQGHEEPTGTAKITRAYNLPSRFVLHTVGPIIRGQPSSSQMRQLQSCYQACLDVAAEVPSIRTLAFCAISTGIFGFPRQPAARLALAAVADWLTVNPDRFDRIVFNVFSAEDEAVYAAALKEGLES